MSSKKRRADIYITDQNWEEEGADEEDIPEPFKQATEDVLSKRTFKKAARRVNSNEKDKVSNPFSAFGGFDGGGGFGAKAKSLPSASTFDVKSGNVITGIIPSSFTTFKSPEFNPFTAVTINPDTLPKEEEKFSEGFTNTSVNTSASETEITLNEDCENNELTIEVAKNKDKTTAKDNENDDNDQDKYFTKLASLNKCALKWIEKHMEENACIDLTPVFGDYEKHLKGISG